MLMAEGI